MVVRPDRFRDPGGHETRSSLGSMGCVTRLGHATFEGCGSGGGELDDRFGCGELEFGQQVADGFGQLGADGGPGLVGGRLDDADQQQGQPAQRDVGADAFFQAVVDRPQVDDLFHVPPAAFDFQQLLVADRDVLGGQVRVGAAQQVLAVEGGFDLDRFGVDAQPAGAGDAQVAVEAGFGGDDPTQFRAFGRGQRVRAGDHLVEVGQHAGPGGGVTLGGVGVVADDEPLVVADADFLDPQVVGDVLVAALAGQGGGGLGRAGAQLLADDVVVVAVAVAVAVVAGRVGVADAAVLVAGEWFVGLVEFEVGGWGVEEQRVDFQVEQGGHRPEHFFFQGVGDLVQPVHGPVAGVVGAFG